MNGCPFIGHHAVQDPREAVARVRQTCIDNGLGDMLVTDLILGTKLLFPKNLAAITLQELFSDVELVSQLWVSGLYHVNRALMARLRECADQQKQESTAARCPMAGGSSSSGSSSSSSSPLTSSTTPPRTDDCRVLAKYVTEREMDMLHKHVFTASKYAARYVVDHPEEFHKALTVQFCLWTQDVNVLASVFDPNTNSRTRQERMRSASTRFDKLRAEATSGSMFHISDRRATMAITEVCRYAMVRVKYDPFSNVTVRRNDPYLDDFRRLEDKGKRSKLEKADLFGAMLDPLRGGGDKPSRPSRGGAT
jgi:hypothetical protein